MTDNKHTKLYQVIAAILCDIAKAQDVSNEYSVVLAEKYIANPTSPLEQFPVPNGLLSELEVDFSLGFDAVRIGDTTTKLEDYYQAALTPAIESMIKKLVFHFNEGVKSYTERIHFEKIKKVVHSEGWVQFITRGILNTLKPFLETLYHEEEKNYSSIVQELKALLEKNLFQHEEVLPYLKENEVKSQEMMIENELSYYINEWSTALKSYEQNYQVPEILGQIDNSKVDLLMHPGKFKLKVSIRDFNWVISVQNDGGDNYNVTYKRLILDKDNKQN